MWFKILKATFPKKGGLRIRIVCIWVWNACILSRTAFVIFLREEFLWHISICWVSTRLGRRIKKNSTIINSLQVHQSRAYSDFSKARALSAQRVLRMMCQRKRKLISSTSECSRRKMRDKCMAIIFNISDVIYELNSKKSKLRNKNNSKLEQLSKI